MEIRNPLDQVFRAGWKLDIHEKTPFFHVDACQAMNYLPIRVDKLGIDLMTFNSSKIYGPKGVGALYKKRNVLLEPIMHGGPSTGTASNHGGGQEFGLRAGTENVAGIAGLAKALEIAEKIKEKESNRLIKLRDYFIDQIEKLNYTAILQNSGIVIRLNGDLEKRLSNNVNISIFPSTNINQSLNQRLSVFPIESELLVIELNARGIAVSSKSACQAESPDSSYVIKALTPTFLPFNKGEERGGGTIRFTLGRQTTKKDIYYTVKALEEIINKYKNFYA